MNMDEVKVLSVSGMLGSGYLESSLKKAMTWNPDFIGCDAGSTDGGAASLGEGKCSFSKAAVKRDLRLALMAARNNRIPFLTGSAGMAGADPNLAWTVDIAKEIAREENLHFKMAIIHAEQDKAYLKRKWREGKIRPLKPAPPYNEEVIDRSEHIVGMMGAEPFIRALEQGAEVVIAGRSSDTAGFSARSGVARRQDPRMRSRLRSAKKPGRWYVCMDQSRIFYCGAPQSRLYLHAPECRLPYFLRDGKPHSSL
jgi:hypothetical protein